MYLGVDVAQPLVVLSHGFGLAEGSVRICAHAMLVLQGKWGSGSFPCTMPYIGTKMVVSIKKRTPRWPQYIVTLIVGTPQKRSPHFRKLPCFTSPTPFAAPARWLLLFHRRLVLCRQGGHAGANMTLRVKALK